MMMPSCCAIPYSLARAEHIGLCSPKGADSADASGCADGDVDSASQIPRTLSEQHTLVVSFHVQEPLLVVMQIVLPGILQPCWNRALWLLLSPLINC